MNAILTVVLTLAAVNVAVCQDREVLSSSAECDSLAAHLSRHADSLDIVYIGRFLNSFADATCANNVEYSEWANEFLFDLMDRQPQSFYAVLFSLSERSFSAVQHETMHPVNDGIDVISIFHRLQKSNLDKALKSKATTFLRPAYLLQREEIDAWEKKNHKKWQFPH